MHYYFLTIFALLCNGCFASDVVERTWHEKFNWKAELYFEDPQVIALCQAIEASDIKEIDRLVAAGADVNAKGKGNMTPLMWAWPDNKLARFKRLLEHGADPNVTITSDLGTGSKTTLPGVAITHLATKSNLFEHFKAVFDHGGDPNLPQKSRVARGDTPPCFLIQGGFRDKKKRMQVLIDNGLDLNRLAGGRTLPMRAVGWGGQYDIALMLLKAGANPGFYKSTGAMKLTHSLVREENRGKTGTLEQKADYQKLVDWMGKHGESLEEARADLDRWKSWTGSLREKRGKLNAEIAARKARQKREQEVQEAAKQEVNSAE